MAITFLYPSESLLTLVIKSVPKSCLLLADNTKKKTLLMMAGELKKLEQIRALRRAVEHALVG